jgi:transposase-like protein
MAHGVNANLVHGWRRLERERRQAASAALHEVRGDGEAQVGETVGFVPVTVEQSGLGTTIENRIPQGRVDDACRDPAVRQGRPSPDYY